MKIEFHGIANLGDDNLGEPFVGVVSDERNWFGAGMITGDLNDCWEFYADTNCSTLEEWERLNRVKVERITFKEACLRKFQWMIEKSGGQTFIKWATRDGHFIKFDISLILQQLKNQIEDEN